MKKFIKTCFILPLLILSGCTNDDAQLKFENQAYVEPSNFTETDGTGNIVRQDSDDWRISPLYIGLADVFPIFPNPVLYGSSAELEVELTGAPVSSVLELGFLTETNNWVSLQFLDVTSDFDVFTFRIDTRQFGSSAEQARGLHRILLFDGNQRMISYGDILIQ